MSVNTQAKTLKLGQYESRAVLSLTEFVPGVYHFPVQIYGNGLLSTMYVSQIGGGASVSAGYWDYSTGLEDGERNEIGSHKPLTAANTSHRTFISGTTGKMFLEITVAGGPVTLGIYVSVLTSIATDTGQALTGDGEQELPDDRGIIMAGYDEDDDRFYYLRTDRGALQVAPAGFPKFAFGAVDAGAVGDFTDIPGASIALTPGKSYSGLQGLFSCSEPAEFIVQFDDDLSSSVLASMATGIGQYTVQLSLASVSITAGITGPQLLKVQARNTGLPAALHATICCIEDR